MAKDFSLMEDSNRSGNPTIHEVSDPSRRRIVQGGTGAALTALFGVGSIASLASLGGCAVSGASDARRADAVAAPADFRIGFERIAVGRDDSVVVPDGYEAQVFAAWGEPVGIAGFMPAWNDDASNAAREQEAQMGMHHDGLEYFPLDGSRRGLLVMNHEYADDGLLHPDGMGTWNAQKVRKSQAAHGISVIEVALQEGRWTMVRPSRFARRLTAYSPFALGGPAASHRLMRTAADPQGVRVLGTVNNCASSMTPWGTYLSGEENFAFYFESRQPDAHLTRWGVGKGLGYRWAEHDERFNADRHPNEPNRFGWVVEVDPMDPDSTPVKRTALGRAAHEGAWVAVTRDHRAVVYSGEDARFEYIYKFVSRDAIKPGGGAANRSLLDHGTLHVARFEADGTGRWIPLVHGQGPLTAANGFADQGEVVIKARQASDLLGATRMDRPEWMAIDAATREVYCTLTNNSRRGADGFPGPDAANPRANNVMGQIIRWQEDGDFDARAMRWNHLVLAGDPAQQRAEAKGNIRGDIFACPDGIVLDARGVLWVQTDAHASQMYKGELVNMGNNQMLACDLATGEMHRFLTGPVNSEVTGATFTPDGRTLFINIQHPGETPTDRSDPADPARFSKWPGGSARPRSATVVIRKSDGGIIGS